MGKLDIVYVHIVFIDDLLLKYFKIKEEQLKKIKFLYHVIKQKKLTNFYLETHVGEPDEFKDWRKVALYFVGKFIKGPKAGKLSCTGYFYPTLKQAKDERIKRQGNYYIDKIDLDNFEIKKETRTRLLYAISLSSSTFQV